MDADSAALAEAHGIQVVMDRCLKVESMKAGITLLGAEPTKPLQ